jgi:hypothetical protein
MATSRANDRHLVIQTEEVVKVAQRNVGEKGDPGIGIPGEDAQSWNPTGAWSSSKSYSELDVVVHTTATGGNGSAYICLQANSNKAPSANPLFWSLIVQSVEGPQGPGGDNTTTAVQVGIWRGAWASGLSYQKNALVRYEGSTYICETAHTSNSGNNPGVAGDKWTLFTQRGAVGATGSAGPAGPAGPTGAQGPAAATSLSLGPWVETRVLGWVNSTGRTLSIFQETETGDGTLVWRKRNGVLVYPGTGGTISLSPGDLFEVRVENITSDRYYLSYRVNG